MKKLSQDKYEKLINITTTNTIMRISCLAQGFSEPGIYIAPYIFVGPQNKSLILWPEEVTIKILSILLNKIIIDDNIHAAMGLLQWAIYNKKRFWQKHRKTPLGILVMAQVLGKHE